MPVPTSFGAELKSIDYGDDNYIIHADETILNDGMLFLCIDNPALKLLEITGAPTLKRR